jgi:hypothetical protein
MVVIYVSFTHNKWFMTSTVRRPTLDLDCCATDRERGGGRETGFNYIKHVLFQASAAI